MAAPNRLHARILRALDHPLIRLAILALVGIGLRWSTFGDPDLAADETFYHTVGIAMHQGALPYVDVWDRKPLGLFIIYWAITGLSTAPLAYQIAATACAIGTAGVIAGIVRRWTGPQGALLAALLYLVWLPPLFGFGGQSPVFYNLLIASAAWLTLQATSRLSAGQPTRAPALAMLLAGLAITVKTTALFEGVYFGLTCCAALVRGGIGGRQASHHILRTAAGWALLGLAPTAAIASYYAAIGHWPEYWHAMITANLAKSGSWASSQLRLLMLWQLLLPLALVAATGLVDTPRHARPFVIGWLIAALVGLGIIPNFYPHYALPLLVVLCVVAAPVLDRGLLGTAAAMLVALLAIRAEPPFRPGQAERSAATFSELASAIRHHDGGRSLLVYAGPAQLYPLSGHRIPTPLAFETHLSQTAERNVSHLDTVRELKRVLATRPGAVVVPIAVRNGPVIPETRTLVNGYVRTHCQPIIRRRVEDWLLYDDLVVWGDCRD